MAKKAFDDARLEELLYQALEVEMSGVRIYDNAIQCALNEDLRREWQQYLEQTQDHRRVLLSVFQALGLDPEAQPPGRQVVGHIGASLARAIQIARASGDPVGAELVACECVVLAETKDHMNWELIGQLAKSGRGEHADLLLRAYERVEPEEDEHLYRAKGWARELWLESLGLPAVLPPPEEVKQGETAIGAVRAEHAREQMLKKGH